MPWCRFLDIAVSRARQTETQKSDVVVSMRGSVIRERALEAHRVTSGRLLATMTTSSHTVTMKQVRVAELKARLSEYLRAVKRGETIAVLDRDTPVAEIVPIRNRTALRVRKPAPGTPPPNRVPLPKPAKLNVDVVQLLLEERQAHR